MTAKIDLPESLNGIAIRRNARGRAVCACSEEFLCGRNGDLKTVDPLYFFDAMDGNRHTYSSCGPTPNEAARSASDTESKS